MAESKSIGKRLRWLRNYSVGFLGEWIAEQQLRALGHKILARRLRLKKGEIDLISIEKNTLVICEVKTRTKQSQDYKSGLDAVDEVKLKRLRTLAHIVLRKYSLACKRIGVLYYRIDVIEVIIPSLLLKHSQEVVSQVVAFEDWKKRTIRS